MILHVTGAVETAEEERLPVWLWGNFDCADTDGDVAAFVLSQIPGARRWVEGPEITGRPLATADAEMQKLEG